MSMFALYLIMQLDSIICALNIASIIGVFVATGALAAGVFIQAELREDGLSAKAFSYARKAVIVSIVCGMLIAFLPSSRSAAVIVVLPAIANNEAVQHEAGDLYALAKEGLAAVVAKAKQEQAPKAEEKE